MSKQESAPGRRTIPQNYEMDLSRLPDDVRPVVEELIGIKVDGRPVDEISRDIADLATRIKNGKSPEEINSLAGKLFALGYAKENFPSGMLASKIGFFVSGLLE